MAAPFRRVMPGRQMAHKALKTILSPDAIEVMHSTIDASRARATDAPEQRPKVRNAAKGNKD